MSCVIFHWLISISQKPGEEEVMVVNEDSDEGEYDGGQDHSSEEEGWHSSQNETPVEVCSFAACSSRTDICTTGAE
jgi:hypothetical protein